MKTFINIELQEGETLLQAIDALIAGTRSTCGCAPADKPATTAKTVTHEETEEAPVADEKATPEEESVKESSKAPKAKKTAAKAKKAAEPADGPDFEDVRAAAMKAINAGKRTEVEAVLAEHGGKLKGVDPANYPDVLTKLEGLL